jgi:dipeptidase D
MYMSDTEILDDSFEPKAVHDHFMKLTTRYHPSGEENEVREYIIECAGKIDGVEVVYYEPEAEDPGKRVIVLRRKGSGDYASAPYVTLQAHTDMVCTPNKEIFPLNVFGYSDEEGAKWIKAGDTASITDPEKGTTLGADDGIGVATILALVEDENLKDYPIECFFTVQEETDMGGAANFDQSILVGRRYINLDAEVANTIIYGSAGGRTVKYEGDVTLLPVTDEFITLELSISGLRGGHSGVNINNGRLNAIKVITEALIRLNKRLTNLDVTGEGIKSYDLRLISINSVEENEIKEIKEGKRKIPTINKIPTWVKARIAIQRADNFDFKDDFDAYCEALKAQSQPEEDNFCWKVEEIGSVQTPLDEASTDELLCLLRQIPHGVINMIPSRPDIVEISSNLAAIEPTELNNGKMVILALNRSSNSDSMEALIQVQENIGKFYRYDVSNCDPYPVWQPNDDSELLQKAGEVYREIYPEGYIETVIHAGLECSYIVEKYEGEIDCISIGPTIVNPHTGGERLKADTVGPFYQAVTRIIKSLF